MNTIEYRIAFLRQLLYAVAVRRLLGKSPRGGLFMKGRKLWEGMWE